ncbi:MAG: hypothetical protein JNJ76_03755 [Candidatus Competibacter sp.]|jgi:hypothetical protein|nr:hypothetical protein [Candidatus Competibacter sp.]
MNPANWVSPIDLRDFLKAHGWVLREEGIADRRYVLQNPRFPRRQLVFPMDTTVADYAESVYRVLEKLGEMIGERPPLLLNQVQTVRDDALRFRIYTEQGGNGSLPLGFAALLVTGAEQLLKAAACTVLRPRLHHPRLALTEALQLIEKTKFGQTETGSFILKVSCPIHALDTQGTIHFDEKSLPFVRQVTLTLKRGIEQLIGAIENDTLDRWIEELKKTETPLVSSNLCEAVTQFHDEGLDNALDLFIDWSTLEPVDQKDRLKKPLRIQRDYFGRIEEVRRELRPVSGHTTDTFIGTVEDLCGEMGEDGQRSGEVILALLLREGETTQARVTLSAEAYRKAYQAHGIEGAYVEVTGNLQQGRQPRTMTALSRFELLLPKAAAAAA